MTAAVTGTLTNSGKVLSQQVLDVRADRTDNRGQLLAKVLTLRGDLQNSGLLQGSNTLARSGNTFTNQPQGRDGRRDPDAERTNPQQRGQPSGAQRDA